MSIDCCDFFKAVSDKTRVRILELLKAGEMCVTDICKNFSMSQPSISHHLGILKKVGVVNDRKVGKEVIYKLNCDCIDDCCSEFMASFGSGKGEKE